MFITQCLKLIQVIRFVPAKVHLCLSRKLIIWLGFLLQCLYVSDSFNMVFIRFKYNSSVWSEM
jgi:hypothetical protein